MKISAAGMRVQGERLRVVAENVANSNTTGTTPGAEPYRRKVITFENYLDRDIGVQMVRVDDVRETPGGKDIFGRKYAPSHPAANEEGYVLTPNVNRTIEMIDMREAQRSYEANLSVIEVTKGMVQQTLGLLR
jgi:flagellar basal-body rod protein FlgC